MSELRVCQDPRMVPYRKFEEYKDRYKEHFFLDRTEDGIMTAKWHTDGKELVWNLSIHRAIHQLAEDVGQDSETEIFILGGTGKNWTAEIGGGVEETPENKKWLSYEHMYYDGCNICENLIWDIQVPTIGVINGPGMHTEMALFCDITLIADDATIVDPHYFSGMVPGDGIQIAFREAMGLKRANYAMLMGELITPQKALEYGMVNEIVPKAKIYDRALEIARQLMKQDRISRRATVQILRQPWKEALSKELRGGFGTEMWTYLATNSNHNAAANGGDELLRKTGAQVRGEYGMYMEK